MSLVMAAVQTGCTLALTNVAFEAISAMADKLVARDEAFESQMAFLLWHESVQENSLLGGTTII
jgi:hypothetical protein